MTKTEFASQIEKILEAPAGTVAMSTPLADLDGWDSLAMLGFIAMADSHLGASVSVGQLAKCKSVGELAALFPGKVEA